ncbi:hypothetical protein WJX84_008842 [Apatococcus fuscideae]|uniref:EF-hand domain-containing protein n=1 Tax=Apatococcus fuscideae TaxID=2026836 RepID=A0AAW1STU2_9CHLO
MAGVLRNMLYGPYEDKEKGKSTIPKVPEPRTSMSSSQSFNDLSMGASNDYHGADDSLEALPAEVGDAKAPRATKPSDPWASVFNPGRNMKKGIGKDYYDHTHDHSSSPGTTWDHIIKASRMKTFADFDRDGDGYISASDLRAGLGGGADVDALIFAADKNKDGRIDHKEFDQLLRNS